MDDVSRFQKITNLARELMKHGQANSMDDAMRIATEKVDSGSAPVIEEPAKVTPVDQTVPVPPPAVEAPSDYLIHDAIDCTSEEEQAQESFDSAVPSGDDLLVSLEKVVTDQQALIGRMTELENRNQQSIRQMNEKINSLISEITNLKAEVLNLKSSPVAPAITKKTAQQGQTQFKPDPVPKQPQEKPKGDGHARSGNYVPDDVSIEKFFYCGR